MERPGWILQPNQVLVGNYRIEHMIGSPGGMGQVFAAEEIVSGTKVAIKVPSLNILQAPKGGERFLREARIAERLGPHPHIVRIRGCLVDPDLKLQVAASKESIPIPFIVMEYLGGGDLAALLRNRPMDLQLAGKLFDDISSALRCAHYHVYEFGGQKLRGVVHRDLKPENVCFDDTGRLVVVDFGIARILGDLTSTLGAAGTPAYMAPEQWNPTKGVDHRTDIYALAIILFQMLTGELPFTGGHEELMAAHMLKIPPDPRDWRKDLPEGIATAIRRALQKEKEARFPNVEEFAQAVGAVLSVHRGSPPTKPDDKVAAPTKAKAEQAAVGPVEACASCETPGLPDAVGGKLYCSNCGSLWSLAAANRVPKKSQAAEKGLSTAPQERSPAGASDAVPSQKCARCGQSGLPDVVSGRQYCASCGAVWDLIEADGNRLQEGAGPPQSPSYSWVRSGSGDAFGKTCPACGSSKPPATLPTGSYCDECGIRISV